MPNGTELLIATPFSERMMHSPLPNRGNDVPTSPVRAADDHQRSTNEPCKNAGRAAKKHAFARI
jgi:hypothetical protein